MKDIEVTTQQRSINGPRLLQQLQTLVEVGLTPRTRTRHDRLAY
jgi:hypothetical protein